MANPLSILYSELLSQQRTIYLGGSNNTLNKEQLSSFYLSSQLQLARNVGQENIGISIVRANQIKTVFPYNIQTPDKLLGVSEPKMFWIPWKMIQKRISKKTFLAKYDFRKSGGHDPHASPSNSGSENIKKIKISLEPHFRPKRLK